MQRRLAVVRTGFRPRFAPPCFPGNQSRSLSTSLKHLESACGEGQPPPTWQTHCHGNWFSLHLTAAGLWWMGVSMDVMWCGEMQAKPMTLATWLPSRHGRRSTAVVLAHRAARGWPHAVRAPGLVAMGTSSRSVQQAMRFARSSGLAYQLTEASTNSLWRRRSGSANMTSGKSETCSVRWRCPWGSGINIQM